MELRDLCLGLIFVVVVMACFAYSYATPDIFLSLLL